MTTFTTTIRPPGGDDEDSIPAEVSYEMRDVGVMGHHNENFRPVIRVVCFKGGRLKDLTDEQVEQLEEEALKNQDALESLAESARFGGESV